MTSSTAIPVDSAGPNGYLEPPGPQPNGGLGQSLAGLSQMARLAFRRDRLRTVLWAVGIIGVVAATGSSITQLYNTQAQLDQYGQLMQDNAALIVQAGPGYGLQTPTTGSVIVNELGIWMIIAFGLMNIFIVVRHTRTEEETGRAELARAAPVGRYTATSAALIVATATNLIIATGVVITLLLFGLPLLGSVAFGFALLGAGSTFAAVGLVAAQVAANSRTALAMGGVALAASFVLRAVGDVGSGHASWLSPIGWAQAIRAYADERWWVMVLPTAATVLFVALAFSLQARRDFGAGLVTPAAGRAHATDRLRTPLALAVRTQRATITGWTVGLGLMGLFYGIVADQADTIIEDNPEMEEFFAHLGDASVTDAYLATSVLMLALIASGFTISSVLRMRAEEIAGRADSILAARISRTRWATGHLLVAAAGTLVVVGVSGAAMGAGFAAMSGDLDHIATLFAAAVAQVPALWVMGGVSMLLYSISPNWSIAAWLTLVGVLVVGILGNVLDLPTWTMNVSPFQHVPAMPAESFTFWPILFLLGVAATATAGGIVALRRRDML